MMYSFWEHYYWEGQNVDVVEAFRRDFNKKIQF